jgi:hypothetical protein
MKTRLYLFVTLCVHASNNASTSNRSRTNYRIIIYKYVISNLLLQCSLKWGNVSDETKLAKYYDFYVFDFKVLLSDVITVLCSETSEAIANIFEYCSSVSLKTFHNYVFWESHKNVKRIKKFEIVCLVFQHTHIR